MEMKKELFIKHNIKLAVLFGSRAKGESRPDSDWDLAILFKDDFYGHNRHNMAVIKKNFLKELCSLLETSKVDLVILNKVSPFLKYRVAKSGVPLFEENEGDFAAFASLAVRGYSDSIVFMKAGKRYLEKRDGNG
jgi:uncharacterized protein